MFTCAFNLFKFDERETTTFEPSLALAYFANAKHIIGNYERADTTCGSILYEMMHIDVGTQNA